MKHVTDQGINNADSIDITDSSLNRRTFTKVGLFAAATVVTAATLGSTFLLSGCKGKGKYFEITAISGAVLVASDAETGECQYKEKCSLCGWEDDTTKTVQGVEVSTEFTCPRCGYLQKVDIIVAKVQALPAAFVASVAENCPETLANLMSAVAGEAQANANYLAFADVAKDEGYTAIAEIFRAIAAAELQHADDEFAIAKTTGAVTRPQAGQTSPGTTKENLQAAIAGETEEYTVMYPEFLAAADEESLQDAIRIFIYAMKAEEVHARVYTDLLANLDQLDREKYSRLYRCSVCGNIELTTRPIGCLICAVDGDNFIEYAPFGT